MCNDQTLKNAMWEEMDIAEPPNTILRPGATEEEVLALEQRLGHHLPRDYKEGRMGHARSCHPNQRRRFIVSICVAS